MFLQVEWVFLGGLGQLRSTDEARQKKKKKAMEGQGEVTFKLQDTVTGFFKIYMSKTLACKHEDLNSNSTPM